MRILAVDPGERHIGLALSDPTGLVARPLTTLRHTTRAEDVARIVALANEHHAEMILLGWPLNAEGGSGPAARHSEKLADALRQVTTLTVRLHDESHSSQLAQDYLLASGKKRRDRREQIHAVAAATILQSYLDAQTTS